MFSAYFHHPAVLPQSFPYRATGVIRWIASLPIRRTRAVSRFVTHGCAWKSPGGHLVLEMLVPGRWFLPAAAGLVRGEEEACEVVRDEVGAVEGEDCADVLVGADNDDGAIATDLAGSENVIVGESGPDVV